MSLRLWLASWLAIPVIAVAGPRPVQAGNDGAECSYIEVAATKSDKPSIDPELKPLEKKLEKGPLSAWNTFKKLSNGAVTLGKNKPETMKLKQGAASMMLRDRSAQRVELTVTMDNAKGKRVLEAKPAFKTGDWLILGEPGDDKDDTGHVLALTCK